MIRTPFLSIAGQGFSAGIHANIRHDLSPALLGFGRMAAACRGGWTSVRSRLAAPHHFHTALPHAQYSCGAP
jgi:hypothetical protein